nr:hypothetical protein GCM10020063_096410 [Dactylosporangium thailandense]
MRSAAKAASTPPGVGLILADVSAAPDSSISQITARTGLPQSYVSESVARLRDQGVFETSADPGDGRRTLVRVSAAIPHAVSRSGAVTVDEALLAAAGTGDPAADRELVAALETLADRLVTRS